MKRVAQADWAASTPWAGITGKPDSVTTGNTGVSDLSQMPWAGARAGYVYWNGSSFSPRTISTDSSEDQITDGTSPGIAVRRRPLGDASGAMEERWARYVFNIKEYGADGLGGLTAADAANNAIAAINENGYGVLYCPAGAYPLDVSILNEINVPCAVVGDGVGVSRILCNGNDGFSFWGCGTAILSNISIEGASTGAYAADCDIHIDNAQIEASQYGLRSYGVTAGFIDGLRLLAVGTAAYGFYGDVNTLQASNISICGSVGTSFYSGLHISAGTGLFVNGVFGSDIETSLIYLGTGVSDSRFTNIIARNVLGPSIVTDEGTNNYVNEIQGIGGNTDDRFEARKELFSKLTWSPGGIQPGYGYYEDFVLDGASVGDQVVAGLPEALEPWVFTDARVTATDSARLTMINVGTSAVFVGTSIIPLRLFN